MVRTIGGIAACLLVLAASSVQAEESVDQQTMGYWLGEYNHSDGPGGKLEVKLMALGDNRYEGQFVVFTGAGADDKFILQITGARKGDDLVGVAKTEGGDTNWKATIADGKFKGSYEGPSAKGVMSCTRTVRKSPAEGAKAPEGAIVLFDGKNLDAFQAARGGAVKWPVKDGVAFVPTKKEGGGGDIVSKHQFTDAKAHVEFRTPFLPKARGQARGNSGVYLQGRFEVQVLDSFGQPPRDNEVGGIYEIAAPKENAGYPPGEWQTYDIVFHAPKAEGGKITKPGTITVDHNGVRIHENVELTRSTRAALDSNFGQPGGLMLQDHGNPVQYRNIWIAPIK